MGYLEEVKQVVAHLAGCSPDQIDDHQPIDCEHPDSVGLDSLDRLDLIVSLEERFDIYIPDKDVDEMMPTCHGIAAYLQRSVS